MNIESGPFLLARHSACQLEKQASTRRSQDGLWILPYLWDGHLWVLARPQWIWLSPVTPQHKGDAHKVRDQKQWWRQKGYFPSVLEPVREQLGTEQMSRWFQIYQAAAWPPRQSLWDLKVGGWQRWVTLSLWIQHPSNYCIWPLNQLLEGAKLAPGKSAFLGVEKPGKVHHLQRSLIK